MATFITSVEVPAGDRATLRIAVKDLIDVAGMPTTNGSKVVAPTAASDGPVARDAACMAGTRAAVAAGRAVIVGKVNMHELAFGVSGINPWYGTPVNPLDPSLIPGGSSSGSAVVVATGEADVSFGTDTGGSIRVPAACCGVVGLKTTRGRIPLDGVRPLAPSLDTVGPMGATVRAVTEGMSLLEPRFRIASGPARTVGRIRMACEPTIDAALDAALEALAGTYGVEISEVELPGWDAATTSAMTILVAEAWQIHAALWMEHRSLLSPDVAERLEAASELDPRDLERARERAGSWSEELSKVMRDVEVIALPTLAGPPPTLEHWQVIAALRRTAPFNLSGNPALSLPVRTSGSAPVPASLQLVGAHMQEEVLLATSAAIEDVAGFREGDRRT